MVEKLCQTCFYSELDGKLAPCSNCDNYDKWVPRNMYIREAAKPLSEAIKYLWRCDLKKDAIEDLKKAKWYIDREINRRAKHNL
jgi:hypothetical protein